MLHLSQIFLPLIFAVFGVISLPTVYENNNGGCNKSYYPSLNEKVAKLKEKYKNGKLEDNQTNVNFDDPDCNRSAVSKRKSIRQRMKQTHFYSWNLLPAKGITEKRIRSQPMTNIFWASKEFLHRNL